MFNASSDKVSVNYSLSLDLLNAERKPSIKKTVDRRRFEFYRSGWVKKILTGFVSASSVKQNEFQ